LISAIAKVENALRRADRQQKKWMVMPYHSAISPADRAKNLSLFSRSNCLVPMVLVCTDRTSRGVDFDMADVGHVILFDFPRDPSEYVRRVGRTGRAGRLGRVTALVLGRQVRKFLSNESIDLLTQSSIDLTLQVQLCRSIMESNKRGERLHPVPEKL